MDGHTACTYACVLCVYTCVRVGRRAYHTEGKHELRNTERLVAVVGQAGPGRRREAREQLQGALEFACFLENT